MADTLLLFMILCKLKERKSSSKEWVLFAQILWMLFYQLSFEFWMNLSKFGCEGIRKISYLDIRKLTWLSSEPFLKYNTIEDAVHSTYLFMLKRVHQNWIVFIDVTYKLLFVLFYLLYRIMIFCISKIE